MRAEQAESIAADMVEAGARCAEVTAAVWRARVDPRATSGLIGAALTLGAGDITVILRIASPGVVMPDDAQMVSHTSDLEGDVGEILKAARDLREEAESELDSAQAAAAAAYAAREEAESAQYAARNSRDAAAADVKLAEAEAALNEAMARISDCECALEILAQAIERLGYALACLQRVPDDLAVTYEAAYNHLRRGGVLPHSGDFLSGVTTR
jgi:phage-related minor tail protein